jgi:hypothetical protein
MLGNIKTAKYFRNVETTSAVSQVVGSGRRQSPLRNVDVVRLPTGIFGVNDEDVL